VFEALGIQGEILKVLGFFVSFVFLALAFTHQFVDAITIDSITVLLVVLAALPWVFPYLKSLELPGGLKLELKDALQKVEKVTSGAIVKESAAEYQGVDTSLAFVALRVEIEKTIRKYQPDMGKTKHSLSLRLQTLANDEVITRPLSEALLEIVKLGNAAAHGREINSEEAELILLRSNALIEKLEGCLKHA